MQLAEPRTTLVDAAGITTAARRHDGVAALERAMSTALVARPAEARA